jgi:DNA-directed RNA polymerase II subunit RPB2
MEQILEQKEEDRLTSDEVTSKIINSFFETCTFVRHHIDSFAYFIQHIIPETVQETVPAEYESDKYKISYKFLNIYLHKPGLIEHDGKASEIYPNDARLRGITYSSPLFITVEKTFTKKLTGEVINSVENVFFGLIPTMVKSVQCRLYKASQELLVQANDCIYDQGGYFIVNGTEKVLMGMERMCTNQAYVYYNKHEPDNISANISSIEERSKKSPSSFCIHLVPSSYMGKKSLRASCNYFKKEFPVGILFKALGLVDSLKYIILKRNLFKNVIGLQRRELENLIDSIEEESYHITTKEKAFSYLTKISSTQISSEKSILGTEEDSSDEEDSSGEEEEEEEKEEKKEKREYTKAEIYIHAVLQKEFLPHIGVDKSSYKKKIDFMVYMIQKLLLVYYGQREFDDHDHARNKRTDESGILIGNIFKQAWGKVTKELGMMIKKKIDSGSLFENITISQLVNNNSLTKDLNYSCATGNWSVTRNSKVKTGVSQVMNRFNFQSTLSHCRRNINPMPKNSVLSKPRQLHSSIWGTTCLAETPEGGSIGLVKNKALSVHISIAFSDVFVSELLDKAGLLDVYDDEAENLFIIFLNGKPHGWSITDDVYKYIRSLKLNGTLPMDIGIYCNYSTFEISIYTDSGRSARPLFVVTDSKIGLTRDYLLQMDKKVKSWYDLISDGIIEMVDSGEQENLLVCINMDDLGNDGINYSHCEISDSLIMGVCVSIIPYANSDPSARIVYQSSMTKQALSVPGTNYLQRMDTMAHILNYPQKPLCQTMAMDAMKFNEMPAGQNAVIAITTNYGHNQEDALIMNKSSVDKGMFRSTYYRTYKDSESRSVGAEEQFGKPDDPKAYKLNKDGIAPVGTWVVDGDIIVGKVSSSIGSDGKPLKPRSLCVKHGEKGFIDRIVISTNPDGTRTIKIRTRQERIPEVGDKFAAVHSQKGVIGALKSPEDLPFTREGIIPDIIINPHSQPSRMTLGHMKEIRSGKYAALKGKFPDATIFSRKSIDYMGDELKKLGYEKMGWETMTDGITGEPMQALIYTGICYYQRLKHMVQDKIHARSSRGPIATLTHQPNEGRSREGGLRVGEMERDTMISLGCSYIIQERLMNLSDRYKTTVCDDCGLLCIGNPDKKIWICKACKGKKVSWVTMPFATKLLIEELYAVGIAPRLKLE